VPCGLNGVLIEGNIAYVGREGMVQPARPTGFRLAAPYPAPNLLARDFENMHRLIGPGTVTLPSANCGTEQLKLGIQKAAGFGGTGPVVLQAAPGERLMLYGRALIGEIFAQDFERFGYRLEDDAAPQTNGEPCPIPGASQSPQSPSLGARAAQLIGKIRNRL